MGINSDYAELKEQVRVAGLLKKQPLYYSVNIIKTFIFLAAGISILAFVENIWLQLLNAAFLGFVFCQISFLGHDAGHKQIFSSVKRNDAFGLIMGLFLGISHSWWVDKHDRHHSNPNDSEIDGDIRVPILAFTREQAIGKNTVLKFFVKFQAVYFHAAFLLATLSFKVGSFKFLLKNTKKLKYPLIERVTIVLNIIVYLGVLIYLLPLWQVGIFVAIHQMLFGFFAAFSFAPNHKGMPILRESNKIDFLWRQVVTSRNIKPFPFASFLYGGLNYQIEHHLFPNMSRNKLGEAREIVKKFCISRSIPYYETSVIQSNIEMVRYMHNISAPLREKV